MKTKLTLAAGFAVGTVIYQMIRHGYQDIEWSRAATVGVITFLITFFIPARFFEKRKTPAT